MRRLTANCMTLTLIALGTYPQAALAGLRARPGVWSAEQRCSRLQAVLALLRCPQSRGDDECQSRDCRNIGVME